MADYDLEDRGNNGNEWDVVSLSASTYAAAPSYQVHDLNSNGAVMSAFGGETPRTMFLSDHFVFPPSEHENLPLELEVDEHVGEEIIDEETNEDIVSAGEYGEEQNELNTLDERDGQQQFGEMHSEEEEAYQSKSADDFRNDVDLLSDLKNSMTVNDNDIQPEIPPASWWKRHAASFYSNAKESNSFFTIFVAAAVMGLVIIGQKWQHERWQVLQLKLHINVNDGKMARLFGSFTRLKDAVIGSHHRISFLRELSNLSAVVYSRDIKHWLDTITVCQQAWARSAACSGATLGLAVQYLELETLYLGFNFVQTKHALDWPRFAGTSIPSEEFVVSYRGRSEMCSVF